MVSSIFSFSHNVFKSLSYWGWLFKPWPIFFQRIDDSRCDSIHVSPLSILLTEGRQWLGKDIVWSIG